LADEAVKNIRCRTRKQHFVEEKIRIVLEALRGEESIGELCRRVGKAMSLDCCRSKEFVEAERSGCG
jgi:transposase